MQDRIADTASARRFEDTRFVTGRGTFTDDIPDAGHLYGFVVRSPHAHAEILSIECDREALPAGVKGVHTASDLIADNIGPLPCVAKVASDAPLIVPPHHALALKAVRHVGDPVAFVVADTLAAAEAAAELVEVDYNPLPAVTAADAAVQPEAPQIWADAPGNLACRVRKGDAAAVEKAFAGAAHIVSLTMHHQRIAALPMETRAAIAEYDAGANKLTLTLTAQGVHGIRRQLAGPVLGMADADVHIVAPDVGGGFGMKNFLYPEWVLVAWAAKHYGQPVRWRGSRFEDFSGSAHGRDIRSTARLALDQDGRFLAFRTDMIADMGAYLSSNGPQIAANAASTAMGGVYAIPAVYMDLKTLFTNTTPVDAYRGAGKPEANFMIERLVDMAAAKLGRSPIDLRAENVIAKFPYRSHLGIDIDSGQISTLIARMKTIAGEQPPAALDDGGEYLYGRGIACFLETARGAPEEGAAVRFHGDGEIGIYPGTESNGQGHETTFKRLAAARFGLDIDCFRYCQADTRLSRMGHGHGGARSMHMGGTALVMAIEQVLDKGRAIAAEQLQAKAAEVEYRQGHFFIPDSGRRIGLFDVAEAARNGAHPAAGEESGIDSFAHRQDAPFSFPMGCHLADVAIDRDTGRLRLLRYVIVDDYGTMLNPHFTAGQVHGGVAQGIGQAMMEQIVYDPDSGQLLTGSFMDYALPRADDLPAFDLEFMGSPSLANPLGVKGSGQAGAIAAPQTIVNAAMDALKEFGIRHLDMPLTSESIWRALHGHPGAVRD